MNNLLNLRSFLKFLSKNWFYTFVEVFGLSVSLMFVILIAVYTYQELSVDRFHEKGDRLYMLTSEECFGSAQKLGEHLKDRYPEIEDATSLCSWFKKIPVTSSTQKSNADLLFCRI